MAYLAPTSDFVTSTLNGAIAAGDATATIGTGLDLPATNGILQIDFDSSTAVGADNGPETISYATYTTGTGALGGCTRGLNGTTGVAHANGAKVQCGPSASYWGSASILAADIATDAVESAKIKADAVTADKLVNGLVYRRQGGSATIWEAVGTTTYDTSAVNAKIQCGTRAVGATQVDVTFPVAFTYAPIVLAVPQRGANAYSAFYVASVATTGFSFISQTYANVDNFYWIAIGV